MVGALLAAPRASTLATLLSFGFYLGVTLFMYHLLVAVNPLVCRLAAGLSLAAGCLLGILDALGRSPVDVNYLVFFGGYCLLLSYLIWRSQLLPAWLGGLLALSGLGWLTFLSLWLAHHVAPYPMVSGLVGEEALTLWLLVGRLLPARPPQPVAVSETNRRNTKQATL